MQNIEDINDLYVKKEGRIEYEKIEQDIKDIEEIQKHTTDLVSRQTEAFDSIHDHIESSIIASDSSEQNLNSAETKTNQSRIKTVMFVASIFGATLISIGGAVISYAHVKFNEDHD